MRLASDKELRTVLQQTLSDSIADGFGYSFSNGQKHIPVGGEANCSLITVKVAPNRLRIFENKFKSGELRASVTDYSGQSYESLSITDRGFPDFIKKHRVDVSVDELRRFVSSFREIFLRVGVSRQYCPPDSDKDGYWLQVNGIYGYPEVGNNV